MLFISPFILMFRFQNKRATSWRWNSETKVGVNSLELDHLSLSLLVASQLEMFATSQWSLFTILAIRAFHTQDDFLGCLCLKEEYDREFCCLDCIASCYLLSEDRLGLSTETLLFTIVTTTTLGSVTFLGLLVL
jgi:hypothetical protein